MFTQQNEEDFFINHINNDSLVLEYQEALNYLALVEQVGAMTKFKLRK